jgi:hypothetical protein
MPNFDDFKLAVEAMSGGKNTVLFDDVDMPSVMVPFPKQKISDIMTGGSENIHPAFSVNSVEKDIIYVSKFQNIVLNSRGYSLPMREPTTNMNFDSAVTYCRNKGKGWSLTPYALWSAIALWCRKNGTMPRGNNNYGQDHSYTHEKGVPATYESSGKINKCLTGSGPATWYHNWMPDGIADLNGNVWEWCAGMRIVNGEIQIIPYSNVFDSSISLGASSTAWKAILADGTLVEPGTSGALKWDWVSNQIQLTSGAITSTADSGHGAEYKNMTLASGLTAPEIAKALLFYPDEPSGDYGGDYHYMNPSGERLPFCGGNWSSGAYAGVFYVYLSYPRSYAGGSVGFRSAFCNL